MAIMQRVRTVFTGVAGTPWYNNLYFDEASGSPNDRCASVDNFWSLLAFLMVPEVDYEVQAEVAFIDDATGDIVSTSPGGTYSGSGTGSGDPSPWATQGLLRLRTGTYVGGRQIQGKVFVPGIAESLSTLGVPSAAAITQMQAAIDALKENEGNWLVYSPTHHTSATVSGGSPWPKWAVLRSRRD